MVLPRIFEPHVSTKAPGRGLGLATVMAVMLGHGGSVSVESSPDGSCFELAFPVPAA